VQKPKEIPQDPQAVFREMIQEITLSSGERIKQIGIPFKMSEMPGKIRLPVPQLGEHTLEVLESLGYSSEQIESLKKEGVV
jgi:crotonobetainyl-CoA:carnitine CoA-transferase CaiB-like acyl-CoA transferase